MRPSTPSLPLPLLLQSIGEDLVQRHSRALDGLALIVAFHADFVDGHALTKSVSTPKGLTPAAVSCGR